MALGKREEDGKEEVFERQKFGEACSAGGESSNGMCWLAVTQAGHSVPENLPNE